MTLPIILLIVSLAVLYFGAEFLVRGSSSLAVRFGISPLVVGLTVVAFGTSAPELLVSVRAAFQGVSAIAVGNVMGSNIFNVCVILGIAAMIVPMKVQPRLIRFDMPVMLIASIAFFIIFQNGRFGRIPGIIFTIGIVTYVTYCIVKAKKGEIEQEAEEIKVTKNWFIDLALILLGLGLLVFGSHLLVDNSVIIARFLGWSEAVIGLTIIAAGTSMPELATSIVAAIKKNSDIAIGNVVGSNIFNLLTVLGITATVKPIETDQINFIDMSVMLGSSLLLLPFMWTKYRISRMEGLILFAMYVGYTIYLLS